MPPEEEKSQEQPAAASQPEQTPPAPAPEPTPEDFDPAIKALMQYDPFAPVEESTEEPKAEPKAPEGKPEETPPATPGPTPAPAETPSGAGAADDRISQILAQQSAILDRMSQPPQTAPQTEEMQVPEYRYNLPDELVNGITSDDPNERRAAMAAMATGVSQYIHRTVMQEVQRINSTLLEQALPQMVQQSLQQNNMAREVFNDFYGTFPQYNHPSLYPTVQSVAMGIAQQKGYTSWTPQFKTEVAQALASMGISGIQAPQPAPAPAPQPYSPSVPSAAPRGNPAPTEAQDVMDTLFG